MVRLDGALNIKNSEALFAVTAGTYSTSGGWLEVKNDSLETKQIGVKVNLEYDDGYTVVTSGSYSSYNAATGSFTTPSKSLKTYINEVPDYATASSSPCFFQVTAGYDENTLATEPSQPEETANTNTEPTNKPTNATESADDQDKNDVTESAPATESGVTENTESTGTAATENVGGNGNTELDDKQGGNGGIIALIVILGVVALAGVAIFVFVIKPKKSNN